MRRRSHTVSDEDHSLNEMPLRPYNHASVAIEEEIMNSAPTLMADQKQATVVELSIRQSEQPITEAPEISHGAWKVIIFLLLGGALFLATVGAYVFSGLHRFQNCL
jgi:hypothetical protein